MPSSLFPVFIRLIWWYLILETTRCSSAKTTDLRKITAVHLCLEGCLQPVHVSLQAAVLVPGVLHLLQHNTQPRRLLHDDILSGSHLLTRYQPPSHVWWDPAGGRSVGGISFRSRPKLCFFFFFVHPDQHCSLTATNVSKAIKLKINDLKRENDSEIRGHNVSGCMCLKGNDCVMRTTD